jgi:hypothetical protein
MKPITAKEFLTLERRDFENGAVRDAIYVALKEREELIKQNKPKHHKTRKPGTPFLSLDKIEKEYT